MAKKIGIKPATTREEAEEVKHEMEEIKTNEYYEVEELTHSIPYLIPQAAELLHDIGKNFQDSLTNLNASLYKVKVTSVTRTITDVKKLNEKKLQFVGQFYPPVWYDIRYFVGPLYEGR